MYYSLASAASVGCLFSYPTPCLVAAVSSLNRAMLKVVKDGEKSAEVLAVIFFVFFLFFLEASMHLLHSWKRTCSVMHPSPTKAAHTWVHFGKKSSQICMEVEHACPHSFLVPFKKHSNL